jgi:hypothetical protein
VREGGEGVRSGLLSLSRLVLGPALGALIASAQLLPTLELSRQSIRATGLDFADAAAFSLPPNTLLTTLLPTIGDPPRTTEWLGYVGVAAGLLAIYGLVRRPRPEAVWLASFALVGLLLAFGQFTPLYSLAFSFVPGVRLFRVPARWLSYWTIGTALLAGYGLEVLIRGGAKGRPHPNPLPRGEGIGLPRREDNSLSPWERVRVRASLLRSPPILPSVAALGVLVVLAVAYHFRHLIVRPNVATVELWLITVALSGALLVLARWRARLAAAGLVVVLVGELFVGSLDLPLHQAIWPDGVEVHRLSVDHLVAQHSPDRVLAIGDNTYDPGDLASLRAMLRSTLPPDAVEQYVTAVKHVEGLTPNLSLRFDLRTIDGYDGGVLPLTRYDDLKKLFAAQGPDVADGRLRIQLKSAPSPALLSWLNVRYLLMDRLRDQVVDGVTYDLALTQPLAAAAPVTLTPDLPTTATSIGIVLGGANPASRGQLRIEVIREQGHPLSPSPSPTRGEGSLTPLPPGGGGAGGEGVSLAPGLQAAPVNGTESTLSVSLNPSETTSTTIKTDTDAAPLSLWRVALPAPTSIAALRLTWTGDKPVQLRSLSLVDPRDGLNQPIPVVPTFRYSLVEDMKIYENEAVLPRAFLADGLSTAPTLDAAVAALRQPTWSAQTSAVGILGDVSPSQAFQEAGPPGDAKIIGDQPERVVVRTQANGQRVLVLTDSAYPGWQATLDGTPVPILTVNLLFRGVIVPAGNHEVVFAYAPASWRIGLILSTVGIVILAAGLILSTRRHW